MEQEGSNSPGTVDGERVIAKLQGEIGRLTGELAKLSVISEDLQRGNDELREQLARVQQVQLSRDALAEQEGASRA